ncbi:RusA family crossover junction endodeoxyribonuclease [Glycomyces arizonensis]|uniref:RusA family crossover junction endodeoxyribonuclease n=1 Tax=Glycomyces arizonensis TaxID=256035 RepID=UPI0004260F17|nr:RusA family crossover junction endodeoxyribonuclease [Glycomyces arizonensis]
MDYPVAFVAYGLPGPQGSKSPKGRRRNGSVILVESSRKVKPWRAAVVAAAADHLPAVPLDGPLIADMVFTMPRPRSHYGTGRNEGVLKARYASARPYRVPDLSKLCRATEDALTTAGVWADDARVVAYGRLEKVYVLDPADPDALAAPGAVIRVREV